MSETINTYERRDVQVECLDAISGARAVGHKRGLVNMATGLGKTYVSALDVSDFLRQKPEARVLYLSNRDHILQHARGTFEEVLDDSVTHGDLFGGEKEDQAQIVYATFQTLDAPFSDGRVYQAIDPREFNYVVADEGHYGQAPTHKAILDHLDPDFLLGMTATPDRRDGRDIREIFGQEIYQKALEEALAEGLLTPVKYVTYMDHVREFGELEGLTLQELNRRVFIPLRDEEIAEIIFQQAAKIDDPHGLIFCASIEHANRMAELLPSAVAIHSKLPAAMQQELRASFKAGEFAFATVVDQFNEGYDFPKINIEAFLRTTTSERIYRQQLGRGLRRAEGKEEVVVIDLAANPERIQTVVTLQQKVKEAQQRLGIISDLHGPVTFEFSTEAQAVVGILEKTRERNKLRQAAINALGPTLPVQKTTLNIYHQETGVTREVPLPRAAMLIMDKIFTSPTGHVSLKTLTEAHRTYFRRPTSQKEMKGYLEEMTLHWILDYCVYLTGRGNQEWRIHPRTVDALRRTEPYKAYFEQSFGSFKGIVEQILEQGRGNEFKARDEDRGKPYRIVRMQDKPQGWPKAEIFNEYGEIRITPRARGTARSTVGESDITSYELFHGHGASPMDVKPGQSYFTGDLILRDDHVEERLRIELPEDSPARSSYTDDITRILPPGEMDTIRRKLESLQIDIYNSH